MNLISKIIVDCVGIIICLVLLQNSTKRSNHYSHTKYYNLILISTALLLTVDIITWLANDNQVLGIHIVNKLSNVLYYILTVFPPYFWYKYVYHKIYTEEKKMKKIDLVISISLIVYVIFALSNLFVDTMFTISDDNIYSRTSRFVISIIVAYVYLAYSAFLVISNKKTIKQTDYYPFLSFFIIPVIAGIIQGLYFGFSLVAISITISALIVYIHVQNDVAITDSLTGLYNRRRFQEYIDDELQNLGETDTLTGIMLDMDNFKNINDTYGHVVGDHALEEMANILRKSVCNSDFLARYAGDEFVVILKNKSEDYVNNVLDEIRNKTKVFNCDFDTEFTISYSFGVYETKAAYKDSAEDFIRNMDKKMYESKGLNQSSKKVFI